MKKKVSNKLLLIGGAGLFLAILLISGLPFFFETSYDKESKKLPISKTIAKENKIEEIKVLHVETPKALKAIYMTSCVASTPSWRESLKNIIKTTELNAVVIDIKDSTGSISFINDKLQENHGGGCVVKDMKEFIEELHKDNIYVIGRISTFQDPLYTKLHPELAVKSYSTGGVWKDRKGLSFVDVGAKQYWDHVIEVAEASYEIGFDEINFDYVRYPSDGNMKDANYTYMTASSTKAQMVEKFFTYLHDHLKGKGMKISADLFGLTTVAMDDLGIGQVLERALPYFDYIYPMVYPSHFGPGSAGYSKPAEHPYEIIKYSMDGALAKEEAYRIKNGLSTSTPSQIKPWLQDFDLGANYGVSEVRGQIKATYDSGINGWLMWDAGNKYTPGAFLTQ